MLTSNAIKVLEKRYLLKDDQGKIIETPDQLFRRVAKALAEPERDKQFWEDKFYEAMFTLKFLPNTPCLMNAGTKNQMLSACFVLPVEDSMEGIFDAVKWAALIHKRGGGTGFSFSRLRPNNSVVQSTHGVASGPVSFMKVFNAATEAVKQGGSRRGANMGVLRIDHPDVIDFINCKKDLTQVTNFNISIALTDQFMNDVKNNLGWYFRNPKTGQLQEGMISAVELFEMIVGNAWSTGEPGIIFIDEVNRSNPGKENELIEATNPCLTGDTWILTDQGPRQIYDLVDKYFNACVDSDFYKSTSNGFFKSGTKTTYILKTKAGYELKLTDDHKIMTDHGWEEAKNLKNGDLLLLHSHNKICWAGEGSKEDGYLLGSLLGDGHIKENEAVLSFWDKDNGHEYSLEYALSCCLKLEKRSDFGGYVIVKDRGEKRIQLKSIYNLALKFGMFHNNKVISNEIEKSSTDFYVGFLSGLFDADGTIQFDSKSRNSIRLNQSNKETLIKVQRMLARLGILSKIYLRKNEQEKNMPDGRGGVKKYHCLNNYELVISSENIVYFNNRITLHNKNKKELIDKILTNCCQYKKNNYTEFLELVESSVEDVYDTTIESVHAFDANGIYVSNCGEQPLPPFDSCNLISIVVSQFVNKTLSGFDEVVLQDYIETAMRFADNLITINKYPIEQIKEQSLKSRRIGLGIMGWADALIQLRIPYDSDKAIEIGKKLIKFIYNTANEYSKYLGVERGCVYDLNRRNTTITNIAPTGTISIIAGCSSGIEPIYAIAYTRNVMEGTKLLEVNPTFKEIAIKEGFYSEELMKRISNNNSLKDFTEIPDWVKKIFRTAADISPEYHVRMQAAFQNWCDAAVSKTVNLPFEATQQDVADVYQLAFNLKCKGVTVYRDGSRPGQVLSTGATPAEARNTEQIGAFGPINDGHINFSDQDIKDIYASEKKTLSIHFPADQIPQIITSTPEPRPIKLFGFTEKIKTGYGTLYITINLKDGHPFEVFASIGKSGYSTMADTEAISRLISLAFRSGITIETVVKQIRGIGGSQPLLGNNGLVSSIPDAIAKVLENNFLKEKNEHIVFGINKDIGNERCPDCESLIIHKEGCLMCDACGYSKC